ncbi:MAG: F0F1 ATP synthase subunit gamma, partial [Gemmatimonadales bacterium]
FGRYTGTGSYKIETRRILPLDPSLLETPDHQPSPLHHLPPAALVEQLAREYLFAEICRAIMESMVTENAVRLRVMESAADGIDDKVGKLTDQERSLRQQEITTELVDVVTGAAAVLGEDTNEVN